MINPEFYESEEKLELEEENVEEIKTSKNNRSLNLISTLKAFSSKLNIDISPIWMITGTTFVGFTLTSAFCMYVLNNKKVDFVIAGASGALGSSISILAVSLVGGSSGRLKFSLGSGKLSSQIDQTTVSLTELSAINQEILFNAGRAENNQKILEKDLREAVLQIKNLTHTLHDLSQETNYDSFEDDNSAATAASSRRPITAQSVSIPETSERVTFIDVLGDLEESSLEPEYQSRSKNRRDHDSVDEDAWA